MMRPLLFLALAMLAFGVAAGAQTSGGTDSLLLRAISEDGVVHLRWAPTTPAAFYASLQHGYLVERAPVGVDEWTVLPKGRIPAPDTASLRQLARTNDMATLYVMAMYADSVIRAPAIFPGPEREAELQSQRRNWLALAMTASVSSREVAEAAGLITADTPRLGAWRYRVSIPTQAQYRAGGVEVDNGMQYVLLPLGQVDGEWGHRRSTITWTWPADDTYAYFDLERRTSGTPWTRLNTAPIFGQAGEESSYTDSLADDETRFEYRLLGTDYFHRKGPPSGTVTGHGLPPIAIATPYVTQLLELPERRVAISWELDGDGDSTRAVGQQVFRALDVEGTYRAISPVLPAGARYWVDSTIMDDDQYYVVRAYDDYGRERAAVPGHFLASDTLPPAPPVGLVGETNLEGHVAITWTANEESDLYAYRVFRSQGRGEPFVRLTAVAELDPRFADTLSLRSLKDSIYYRVVALDYRENVSAYSEILAVGIPDVRPPRSPVLKLVTGDTQAVRISYVPSLDEDLALYRWSRRAVGTLDWVAFDKTAPVFAAEAEFVDSTSIEGLAYEYRAEVIDSLGLRALSNVVVGTRLKPQHLPPVYGLSAKPDLERRELALEWRYSLSPELAGVSVWRARGPHPMRTYAEVDAEELQRKGPHRRDGDYLWRYADEEVSLGEAYRYAVQVRWADGRVSWLGEEVETQMSSKPTR